MNHKHMEELLIRSKNGDKSAALEILEDFMPFILNTAKRFYIAGCDFDDMVQMGRLTLLLSIKKYDMNREFCFPAYAVNAIKNNFYHGIKKTAGKNYEMDIDKFCSLESDDNPEEDYIKSEQLKALSNGLKLLNHEDSELISWFYFQNKTIKEYSKVHHVSYNCVVKKKQRILEYLKKILSEK